MDNSLKHTPFRGGVEEATRMLLVRIYQWWKNTAYDVDDLDWKLAQSMLVEFENAVKNLIRNGSWSINELTNGIRLRASAGIREAEDAIMREVDESYAIFKDAERCDRDLKRCELAAKFVRQRTEKKISAIYEKWADATVSCVLRLNTSITEEKNEAVRASQWLKDGKAQLENRLKWLNTTLKDAIRKFVGNRNALLSQLQEAHEAIDEAESSKNTAILAAETAKKERLSALNQKTEAEKERDAAKSETATAKALYAKASKKAAEADKIADLLRGYWKSWKDSVEELREILSELRYATNDLASLRSQNDALKWERTAYQRTTMRNYQLEKSLSELGETMVALENQVLREIAARKEAEEAIEAVAWENPKIEEELRFTSWSYFAVMLRMEGSDPETQDYSDYERIERELDKWVGLARSKWMDAFSISANAVAATRDEWTSNPKLLKKIWVTRLTAQATYEKCVREFGRKAVPNSVRDVVEKLKIYTDVAWITWSRSKRETIVDAEYR